MPGTLRDKFRVADVKAGQDLAGIILYGFFGNNVDADAKREVLKGVNFINLAADATIPSDSITILYGINTQEEINNFKHAAQGKGPIDSPRNYMVDEDAYKGYTNDAVEDTLEHYRQGMQGLLDFMRENEAGIDFQSDLERDYYYMLRQQVEILASGESLSQKSIDDNTYEYSKMLSSSLNLATGSFTYDTDSSQIKLTVTEPEINTHELFEQLKDTGVIQATVGAAALSNKYDQFAKDGSVGRNEIIEETKLQIARMKKLMDMNEEDRAKLKNLNDPNNEDRSLQYFLWEQEAKLELLTSGWPVKDIPHVSKIYIAAREAYQKNQKAKEEYDAAVAKYENPTNEQQAEINGLKEKSDNYKKVSDALLSFWDDAKTGYTRTEGYRRSLLNELSVTLENVEGQYKTHALDSALDGARKCLNRPLENHEKILMAKNIKDIYDIIDSDDPFYMKSSSEFREMKKSLEKLVNMENNSDFEEYEKQHDKTLTLMQKYASYKHMQLNDPKTPHSRSEREAKRVRDVEAAIYRLKQHSPKPKETAKTSEVILNPNKRQMDVPATTEYDKFIKQHTGYHQIYGPANELVDHVALVMAVTKEKDRYKDGPLPLDEIKRSAEELKREYRLENATREDLASALSNPDTILSFQKANLKDLYGMKGITNNTERYKSFIADIRVLYKNMIDKEGQPEEYQKIFDAVHEMSVLPYMNVSKINEDAVNETIQKQVKIIVDNADKHLETNFKKSDANSNILDALATLKLHNLECDNNELSSYINDIVKRTNRLRGASDNLDNNNSIDLEEDYGPIAIRNIRKEVRNGQDRRPKDEETEKAKRDIYVKKELINENKNNEININEIDEDQKEIININKIAEDQKNKNDIIEIEDDNKIHKTNFNSMLNKQKEEKVEKMDSQKAKIKEGAKQRENFDICTDSKLLEDSKDNLSFSFKK